MPTDLWKRARDKNRGLQEVRRQAEEACPSRYPLFIPHGTACYVSSASGWVKGSVPNNVTVSDWTEVENQWCHFELADGRVVAVRKVSAIACPVVINPGTPIFVERGGKLLSRKSETALFFESPDSVDGTGMIFCRKRSGERIAVHRNHIR